MELTITRETNERKWEKLNVRPRDHARFKAIAAQYQMQMSELFEKCVDALEANLAEQQTDQEG